MKSETPSEYWYGKTITFRRDEHSIDLMMKAVYQIEQVRPKGPEDHAQTAPHRLLHFSRSR
jgi:hypothetical protein